MTTKSTPGPWTIEPIFGDGDLSIVLDYAMPEAGNPVMIANVCQVDEYGICPATIAEAGANARLISAAPDLLAACRSVYRQQGLIYVDLPRIKAAIEKATGL